MNSYLESDPIGLAGGNYSTYSYARANPISNADPLGLKTTVVITYDGAIGSHAALYVTNGLYNEPMLYDPAGGDMATTRGSTDALHGDEADLNSYISYQRSTGSSVKTYTFNTTPAEEAQIANRADQLGGRAPFNCARATSAALTGSGPSRT